MRLITFNTLPFTLDTADYEVQHVLAFECVLLESGQWRLILLGCKSCHMMSCRYRVFLFKQMLSGGEVVNQKLNASCDYLILLFAPSRLQRFASGMNSQRADPVHT